MTFETVFTFTKKALRAAKKGLDYIILVPKISGSKILEFIRNKTTAIEMIEANPNYFDYCSSLAGSMVDDVNLSTIEKNKLTSFFKKILPLEPVFLLSSKITPELAQMTGIIEIMCKYYRDEIPDGSDKADILIITIKIVNRICWKNPKTAILLRCVVLTSQIIAMFNNINPASFIVYFSSIRQILEEDSNESFVTLFFSDEL